MPITTTPSGGPQGDFSTYTPISAQTLSSTAASITFSNIPTTFTDLVLVFTPIVTAATTFAVRFNSDSGSNYSATILTGDGTTAASTRVSSQSEIRISYVGTSRTTNTSNIIAQIQNYSNATTYKTLLSRDGAASDGTGAIVGLWRNAAPITSITIIPLSGGSIITTGSIFTLYGIKAATTAPKATGGDVVYTDNTYWYHVFKNSGVFDVKTSMNVDYLVVAGGGGSGCGQGNNRGGGGGGAGGFRTATTQSFSPIGYTITVGAGGAGTPASPNTPKASNGSNSSIGSFSASGGGGGSSGGFVAPGPTGANGGSGGGAGAQDSPNNGAGGSGNIGGYTPVEGYAGGAGNGSTSGNNQHGAGGGGSSSVGGAGIGGAANPGAGGSGTSNSYSGSAVTYATGGTGGRGNVTAAAVAGTANTGNGAQGAGGTGGDAGAAGGSGIVIVRYAV